MSCIMTLSIPELKRTVRAMNFEVWRNCIGQRFTLDDLQSVIEKDTIEPPRLRLLRNDAFVDPRVFKGVSDGRVVMAANFEEVKKAVFKDSTLIIDNIGPLYPPANDICDEIAALLSTECSANIYCSCTPSSGFGPHADQHDFIAIQLCGDKHWSFPESGRNVVFTEGDALFVKAGVVHDVQSIHRLSIHMTIQFLLPNP